MGGSDVRSKRHAASAYFFARFFLHLHIFEFLKCELPLYVSRGKGADLRHPKVSSLASPHRPKASDGAFDAPRREYK